MQYIFENLQETNPKELIEKNGALEKSFLQSLSFVKCVFDCAEEFLRDYFKGENFRFPIPVREIAQKCNFLIFEDEMADLDSMEIDAEGGRTTIAQILMRERRFGSAQGKIVGTINIDKNLSEYAKRFAIAHELGHYVLRTQNPIGPIFIEDSCPGPFAYVKSKEFLANEFAYALLLPYTLVAEKKKEYEEQNKYNPLNYLDWITVLKDAAQIPEHYAILAYEEIKRYHFKLTEDNKDKDKTAANGISQGDVGI